MLVYVQGFKKYTGLQEIGLATAFEPAILIAESDISVDQREYR